jgi:hypothetical protein
MEDKGINMVSKDLLLIHQTSLDPFTYVDTKQTKTLSRGDTKRKLIHCNFSIGINLGHFLDDNGIIARFSV